jgi:thioester reductase-like protein
MSTGDLQGKYVAERILAAASEDRALRIPVHILRAGLMCGDSKTGYCVPGGLGSRLLMSIGQLGIVPEEEVHIDMNPVDYVAHTLVAATTQGQVGLWATSWGVAAFMLSFGYGSVPSGSGVK